VRGIESLGSALAEMRHAPDPRVLLDVATVQLTADVVGDDTAGLLARIERLERQVAAGAVAPAAATPPAPVDPATGRAALGGRARGAAVDSATAGAAPPTERGPSDGAQMPSESPPAAAPAVTAAAEAPAAPAAASDSAPAPAARAGSRAPVSADAWENTIRPALRGMARAVYAPATFVRSDESTLTLSVPNAVHRTKCEEQRGVVEAALDEFAGVSVTIELLDGDGGSDGGSDVGGRGDGGGARRSGEFRPGSAPSTAPAEPSAGATPVDGDGSPSGSAVSGAAAPGLSPRERGMAAAAATDSATVDRNDEPVVAASLPDDDEIDIDDLVDAPPETVKTPIDRLAEAFPGSELIEEAG